MRRMGNIDKPRGIPRGGIEERGMNIEYLLTGLVALAIGIYLVVALLRPDKF
jgi:K+-transporting ATPase KdpF subunit